MNKRSQVTIFILVGIVLVAGIIAFFLLRDRIFVSVFPAKFQPVETYFLDCVNQKTDEGKQILGERGGNIYLPEFEPGTDYAPFSNQFDFYGQAIPYWYYVSGSSFIKEQVPSKSDMEEQLKMYLEDNLDCDFSDFEKQGFEVNLSKPKVSVKINELSIDVEVSADLDVSKDKDSARQTTHKTSISTRFGKFYDSALKIYNDEKQKMFLEEYSVDVLRLYAPVDGIEISCSPKVWMPEQVVSDLQGALEANIQAIKTKGNYYTLNNPEEKYFVLDTETEESVNFIYSKNWPTKIEISPVNGNAMIAEPVGNQEGLGILGFCYVPYHFVYDLMFPVLIQVYDNNELFQFPVAVIIQKNMPREGLPGTAINEEKDFCKYKNADASVYTYDSRLNPVEADISFKCFESVCDIGKTEITGGEAVLSDKFPQCVNGFVIARAKGFAEKKQVFSTNRESVAEIILDRLYNVSFELKINDKEAENAIIYFNSDSHSATAVWPQQKTVQLSQGLYNVSVYSYSSSTLVFPGTSTRKCVEVPKPGLLGMFGSKTEECFDIQIPSMPVTSALNGGGKTSDYLTEDRLENGKFVIIAEGLPAPTSLEDLQKNYELFETKRVDIVSG